MWKRELFEGLIWPTAQQLTCLEALLTELVRRSQLPRRTDYVHLHGEFQKAIIRLSDQDVVVREAERLWMLTERYRSFLPYNITDPEPMKRRREIFDALRSQDRRKLINSVDLGRQEALNAVLQPLEFAWALNAKAPEIFSSDIDRLRVESGFSRIAQVDDHQRQQQRHHDEIGRSRRIE